MKAAERMKKIEIAMKKQTAVLDQLQEEKKVERPDVITEERLEALAAKENAQTYLAEGSAGVEEAQQKEAGTTELQQGLPPDGDATVAAEQQAVNEAPPGGDGAKGPQAFYDHGVHEALVRGYRERGIVGERAADELARLCARDEAASRLRAFCAPLARGAGPRAR